MNLQDASALAIRLMEEHRLFSHGWSFQWDNAKRRLGQCRYRTKEIGLSRDYVLLNEEPMVRDTILHEIAHALVGPGHGHNRTWKLHAISVGAHPRSCKNNAVMPDGEFLATCKCDTEHRTHRRARPGFYSCKNCKTPLHYFKVGN